ncbi:MAG TPA: hypothetical protein VMH81_00465 [Bryobacteraceae bacterium]|nr:hypothetical protein [Bryobacteraceae bacterium]
MSTNDNTQFEVAADFTKTICLKLAEDKRIHAQTAISAAARMAGTLLLRSSNLPLSLLKPGTPVFSDLLNSQGQRVFGTMGQTLARLKVPFDPRKLNYDLQTENQPHMGLMEVQSLLDSPFHEILRRYSLTEEQGAYAAAVCAAILIYQWAGVVDPHVSYIIATYGIVEGCKTVPVSLN